MSRLGRVAAALLLLLPGLVAGCGDDDTTEAAAAPDAGGPGAAPPSLPADAVDRTGEATVTVDVTDNAFAPLVLVVSAGTEVVWVNEGRNEHNVTPAEEGDFDPIETGQLPPDGSASRTFDDAGDIPYYCTIHGTATRGQHARLIVVA